MKVRKENLELAELRKQAEQRMQSRQTELGELSDSEVKQLVFELGTHQIELEMQNEELRRVQAEVAESRDGYAELYDFAPVGYLTIDQNGRILQANLTATELFEVERAKLIGQFLRNLVYSEDVDDYFLRFRKQMRVVSHGSFEVRLKKTHEVFHARLDFGPNRDVGSSNARRLVAISDITEVRQAEAERNEFQRQLERSQRLESLGVLAGGIAHDFNNLLTVICANNDLVSASLQHDSPSRVQTDQIAIAVQQSAALCQQMLAYAGKATLERQLVDVTGIFRDAAVLIKTSVKKNVSLSIRLAEDLPSVLGDPTQIRQIAMNLVMNAAEASEDEGHVILSTSLTNERDPKLADTMLSAPLAQGEYVCIEVADRGCGIASTDVTKILEPFYTTKLAGRGLGLSVVAGIVRGHAGVVSVGSTKGYGTTIRVLLPVVSKTTGDDEFDDDDRTVRENVVDQGAILVVDDDSLVRTSIASLLIEKSDFRVLMADSGELAVELLRKSADTVSLVLLDVTMPGLSTEATISQLRSVRPDIPIALISGYSKLNVAALMEDHRIAAFVNKPPQNLIQRIRQVLSRRPT